MDAYAKLALKYAKIRWGWDDESFIEELCERFAKEPQEPVNEFIDGWAAEYEFEDPYEAWGVHRTPGYQAQLDAVRKEITAFQLTN